MQFQQPFDANQIDPTQGSGGLPIGRHKVVIIASEGKENSKNTGGFLEMMLQIVEGPNQGMTGADRLNLFHSDKTTVDIAQKRLSAYCHVTGQYVIANSQQLHNIPFYVEIGLQKPKADKPEAVYTEVKKLFDVNGNEPGKASSAPASLPSQAPLTGAQPAWGSAPAQAPAATQAPTGASTPPWGVK